MSSRETKKFTVYDQNIPDYDTLNSFDAEINKIAAPPILFFEFDVQASLQGKVSGLDDLYAEADIINEKALADAYKVGFGGDFTPDLVRAGEIFKPARKVYGYYQEPTWTQELSRIGITVPEEVAVNFNLQDLQSTLGKFIKIGDVIQTFRGKVYRVMDAYVADEVVGWKYIHFHIIAKKPSGLDNLILPGSIPFLLGSTY